MTLTAPGAGTGAFPGPARHKRPSQPPSAEVNAAGAVMNGRSRRPPPAPGHPPAPTAGPSRWAVVSRGCPLALLPPTLSAEPGGTGRGGKPGLLADRCRKGSPGRASRRPVGCPALAAAGAGKLSAGPARDRAPAGDLQVREEQQRGHRAGSSGSGAAAVRGAGRVPGRERGNPRLRIKRRHSAGEWGERARCPSRAPSILQTPASGTSTLKPRCEEVRGRDG